MTNDSLFKLDIKKEKQLSIWLDKYFYSDKNLIQSFSRNRQLNMQHKGVDISLESQEIFGDEKEHYIDEKAAIKYVKKRHEEESLGTFAFELDYYKDSELKCGWLFNDKNTSTEFYLVMWIWADVDEIDKKEENFYSNYDWTQITNRNITKVEGLFLSKKTMRDYACSLGVTPSAFKRLRKSGGANEPRVIISDKLAERPMNIVICKKKLIELATYHFERTIDLERSDIRDFEKSITITKSQRKKATEYSIMYVNQDIDDGDDFVDNLIEKMKSGTKVYVLTYNTQKLVDRLVNKIGRDVYESLVYEAVLLDIHEIESDCIHEEYEIEDGDIDNKKLEFFRKTIKSFNWDQYLIEHSKAPDIAVKAGAGTGKTRTMIQRLMYLVFHEGAELREIAMITFTNEAARSMSRKLKELLIARVLFTGDEKYVRLLETISKMKISTIDSFSKSLVEEYGYRLGYGKKVKISSMKYERRKAVRNAIDSEFKEQVNKNLKKARKEYYELIKFILYAWNKLDSKGIHLTKIELGEESSDFDKLLLKIIVAANKNLIESKRINGAIELSDLKFDSEILIKEMEPNDIDSSEIKYLFIDEFQDTDNLQIQYFVNLKKKLDADLFIVGDEKQSIYRFRGADDKAFDVVRDQIRFQEYSLTTNYRTDSSLLESMTKYFQNIDGLENDSLKSYAAPEKNSEVNLIHFVEEGFEKAFLNELNKVVDDTNEQVEEGMSVTIAILCRKNHQVDTIASILEKSSFKGKFVSTKKGNLFQSEAANDLSCFISLLLYPNDQQIKSEVAATPFLSKYKNLSERFLSWQNSSDFFTEEENLHLIELINELRYLPFLSLMRRELADPKFKMNLIRRGSDSDLETSNDLKDYATKYYSELNLILEKIGNTFGTGTASIVEIGNWLSLQIKTNHEADSDSIDDRGLKILVTTIHKSKGLEYDHVLLPYLDDIFFVRDEDLIISSDFTFFVTNYLEDAKKSYRKIRNDECSRLRGEETRLLYVAMTRAKHSLGLFISNTCGLNTMAGILKGEQC